MPKRRNLVRSFVLVHRGWPDQQQRGTGFEHGPAASLPCPEPAGSCLRTATTAAATAATAKQGH